MDNISKALADAFEAIDGRPIYEWAGGGNIVLPPAYAMPGEFDVRKSRYLIKPFDSIQLHTKRIVSVKKITQSGGTLLADISVPWFIKNRPGPIMWNMQTDEIAEDHARDRAIPVIRACRDLRALLPADPRKMGQHGAELPHMPLYIQGSTPAQLQSKSILFLINDELWIWKPGRLKWALSRVAAFERVGMSKVLNISQAGKKDDDFDRIWKKGSCEEWAVQCDGCRKHFAPLWSGDRADGTKWGMIWDTNDRTRPGGKWNFNELFPTIRYTCPHCDHYHQDTARLKALWNLTGQYLATNPGADPANDSYHWNAIPIESWTNLVEMFLDAMDSYAQGLVAPLVTFLQQRLAENDDPERTHAGENAKTEVYDVQSDWPDEVQRFMHVDVQEDHYWAEVTQFAADGRARQIHFGKVSTDDELKELQKLWRVPDNCVFVDVGYQRNTKSRVDGEQTRRIYAMICKYNWCGLKGEDRTAYPHAAGGNNKIVYRLYSTPKWGDPQSGKVEAGRRFAKYFLFASPAVSDIVDRIRRGKGVAWTSPPGSTEYARQLFAEQKRKKFNDKTGREEWTWVRTRRDNHAFDLCKMKVVTALMSPLIKLDTSTKQDAEPPKTENENTDQ